MHNNFAKVNIKGGLNYPDIKGTILFEKVKKGILVTAEVSNLPTINNKCNGRFFGFHIHEENSCNDSKDEFSSALNHLNLNDCFHPFHTGDFPSLIECDGYAYMQFLTNKFNIEDILGKTVIVHSNPDDYKSQPSGDSGMRIACGVIE